MNGMSGGPAQRSTFVTVVAWIFIVLSGFGTFMLILESFVLSTVMPHMQASVDAAKARGQVPPSADFMFGHMQAVFGVIILLSVGMLLVSIGLLKRRNWARILFIAIMALGILGGIGSAVLQRYIFSAMPTSTPDNMPPEFRAQFESMMSAMQVVSIVFTIAFSLLYGWIIVRLMSASIRREFTAGS
jgi:hypothetical protein